MTDNNFQQRVAEWLTACFSNAVAIDRKERAHRFLEEALELVQASNCSRDDAIALVEYVFSRPVGDQNREVGGVMVTLAGLCSASKIDMSAEGERELASNWLRIDSIRRKRSNKPAGSPLPQ